ncbi:MAG TPA: bifunctional 4-hydroxy-2-oxoglutarate aldolase/2-dehydro-3-deoxy-phosphogluconate aldolase [Christensenellaceae bacterium]|jgi:2-dehydro-3-deoxyphosphogluconate aldolase/(4S)-4-hydroxy-2-oxoglutarate aldolase|nr:bifunctional 4-hydroxy-2-oxoglutarate aldolase/2-dehydro-3-deoxy-phosphogluconate aldolase [Christensenellaceae bacterium]
MNSKEEIDSVEIIKNIGIIPVINIPNPTLAEPLAKALSDGNLPLIEVTLRNDSALESIKRIKEAYPDMLVGAGTVLSCEQVEQALEAGAEYIVTPGFNPKVVKKCLDSNVPVIPGCVTPAEIEAGREMGLRIFKFFPSEQLGGVKTIKELCGPYRDISFVATSGITIQNIPSYLASEHVAAVGGSCMAPAELIQDEKWQEITSLSRAAVRAALGYKLMHVGVNGASAAESETNARRFSEIFDMSYKKGNRSDFAGTAVEFCKVPFPGEKGHIAIGVLSVERAIADLNRRGISFREDMRTLDAKGRLVAIYLEEEIGGFAVHLIKYE